MSSKINLLFILVILLGVGCNKKDISIARAQIINLDGSGTQIGTFYATYENGVTIATVSLIGMPITASMAHAVHLHDGTCDAIGVHWNRGEEKTFCDELSLGKPWGKLYAGDFENISVDNYGNGTMTVKTDLWSIGTNDHTDILNKIVVVHAMPSDFMMECDPNHVPDHLHTNLKLGCGVVY